MAPFLAALNFRETLILLVEPSFNHQLCWPNPNVCWINQSVPWFQSIFWLLTCLIFASSMHHSITSFGVIFPEFIHGTDSPKSRTRLTFVVLFGSAVLASQDSPGTLRRPSVYACMDACMDGWYCMVWHGIVWYCIVHYIALHCIALHYITLHYITLHYITLCTYIHIFIYVYIYIYMCVYIYICINIYIYMYIYICIYIHVCMYIYMYIYIHIYIHYPDHL